MMIDDEPINMRVLQLHLTTEGYQRFVTVSDSTTAMQVLRVEKPNVLLLDLNMPEVSGLEILSQIRADAELKQLPVIVLTSSNNSDSKLQALKLGANDFLPKPVDASELALRMRNTLLARVYEQQLMHVDVLTNLPNRLYFVDYMRRYMDDVHKSADETRVLVLINLHKFKSINDSFGSERGDDVLWAFSQRLSSAFEGAGNVLECGDRTGRQEPKVIRLGGDRFGVVVDACEEPKKNVYLRQCIEALLDSLKSPFVVDSQNIYVDVGIGISLFTEGSQSVETLINHAETAMNNAAADTGKPYAFYSVDMVKGARRLLAIDNAMRTAIDDNGLYVYYQPKVDVASGRITGAEALVRWEHPELGFISPVEFIPVAESSGMILPIGLWVLEQACKQAMAFRRNGYDQFHMAVNVSIAQLYAPDFIDCVKHILNVTALPSHALTLELTENMIMEDVESNIAKLAALKDLGIGISIDDFGTGYSSLSYVQQFPINQLKIDRSFIMQIESADTCSPVVKAIVTLAHDLGYGVVAEGVETAEQLAYIRGLTCGEYQGFYKSRPVSAAEFVLLLQADVEADAA